MQERGVRIATGATASGAWLLGATGFAYTALTERHLSHTRPDLATDGSQPFVYGAALASAATVGLIIAVRRRRHPVGWLFLALAAALALGAAGDAYALAHGVAHRQLGTLTTLALVGGQASFIAWFALIGAVLHLTPTGRPLSRRWGRALGATSVAAVIALAGKLVQDTPFEAPYDHLHNPWAVGALAGPIQALEAVTITATLLGMLVGGVSLVVRFRRAAGAERQQLRWLVLVAVPLPVTVGASAAASLAGIPWLRTLATGAFVALIPIAAGLSVLRYRLYDVTHILSRATSYALSSVVLASGYGAVAFAVDHVLGNVIDAAALAGTAGAVVTVVAAAPLHRRLQDLVDRRFDRRRHDAHRRIRERLHATAPAESLEATLADAVRDPSLTLAFWLPASTAWVTEDGEPAETTDADLVVRREADVVARVRFDPAVADERLLRALTEEAVPELDNIRLRAEVAAQLAEVRASRARIVAAQSTERRRLERNLHDGAQQRLLALAMHLRAGQLRDDVPAHERALLDRAVDELGAAVRDLREIASGLHPTVLADGGLAAALDDLAGRLPIEATVDAVPGRFAPAVEEALWFVACEAVANAVKHAEAAGVRLGLHHDGERLRLSCADDGAGTAVDSGSGIRGMRDRVEAIGGSLDVASAPGSGTTVEAVVPCAS